MAYFGVDLETSSVGEFDTDGTHVVVTPEGWLMSEGSEHNVSKLEVHAYIAGVVLLREGGYRDIIKLFDGKDNWCDELMNFLFEHGDKKNIITMHNAYFDASYMISAGIIKPEDCRMHNGKLYSAVFWIGGKKFTVIDTFKLFNTSLIDAVKGLGYQAGDLEKVKGAYNHDVYRERMEEKDFDYLENDLKMQAFLTRNISEYSTEQDNSAKTHKLTSGAVGMAALKSELKINTMFCFEF